MLNNIEELGLIKVNDENEDAKSGRFVIEPLLPGFGQTVGSSLRRVLLSSLRGAAVVSVKIDGADHEFATIKGVVQDVVEIILNIKQIRMSMSDNEPKTITLSAKGKKKVTAADFKCPTGIEIINKDLFIAELSDKGTLNIEAEVRSGRGYLPTEMRKDENMPIGVIAIDATFSPVAKVNYFTENTRVGKMTNFDKLILEIDTDGSISPKEALKQASTILVDHFEIIASGQTVQAEEVATEEVATEVVTEEEPKAKKSTKKATKKD